MPQPSAIHVEITSERPRDISRQPGHLVEVVHQVGRIACRLSRASNAEKAHEKLTYLQAQFAAYRETQAGQLVSREVLREAESRLGAAIDRLGDRLDSLVKELVVSRREPK